MAKIKSVYHLSFFVNDLEKSVDFYCNKLGLDYMYVTKRPDRPDTSWITAVRITEDTYLELTEACPDGMDRQMERATNYYDDTFYHFSLKVEGIEELAQKWYSKGIAMSYGPMNPDKLILPPFEFPITRNRCKVGWIADPDGNLIEVMEELEDSHVRKYNLENPIENRGI